MSLYKVVVTDNVFPDLDQERERLAAIGAEVVEADPEYDMLAQLEDADAIINVYYRMPAELIGGLKRCRLIIRNGIGIDTIDLAAASAQGIMVANIPSYCLDEVATHTIALILALNRKVVYLSNLVRAGVWDVKRAIPIHSPSALTVGLLGFGRIAQAVCKKASGLGFGVIAHDPYMSAGVVEQNGAELVSLDQLLARADYLSLHCPLTPETRGSVNREFFSRMKAGACLINTSRGPVVDEGDLAVALSAGQIAGAALDVLAADTILPDNPLGQMDNVIITPHAAWYSEQSMVRRRTETIDEVIRVLLGGEPTSFVNRKELAP